MASTRPSVSATQAPISTWLPLVSENKYYIPSNTHFEVWYLILNKETYDDLKP